MYDTLAALWPSLALLVSHQVVEETWKRLTRNLISFPFSLGRTANTPGVAAFTATNTVTHVKKAVASAVMIGMGGVGGIVSGLVYRQKDAPEYR